MAFAQLAQLEYAFPHRDVLALFGWDLKGVG